MPRPVRMKLQAMHGARRLSALESFILRRALRISPSLDPDAFYRGHRIIQRNAYGISRQCLPRFFSSGLRDESFITLYGGIRSFSKTSVIFRRYF
jgi:hypothetical protein